MNFSYVVLPEWYVHEEPVSDRTTEVAMETNENELSNRQEPKKKPMLGFDDSMTVWQRYIKHVAFMPYNVSCKPLSSHFK